MMKMLVLLSLFTALYAAPEAKNKGADQKDQKERHGDKDQFIKMLKQQEEGLNKRLTEVREAISCMEKASDDATQKKCREDFRTKRQAFRQELKDKMKSEKDHKGAAKKDKATN